MEVLRQFDAIWDQSALPVINEMGAERLKDYTSLMQTLLKPDGRHMVEVCKHGANFVDSKMLKSLYGDKSDVRYIGKRGRKNYISWLNLVDYVLAKLPYLHEKNVYIVIYIVVLSVSHATEK